MLEFDRPGAPARQAELAYEGCDRAEREFRILMSWPDGSILDRIGVARRLCLLGDHQAGARLPGALEAGEDGKRGPQRVGGAHQSIEGTKLLKLEAGAE